jgi:hypothetical protein
MPKSHWLLSSTALISLAALGAADAQTADSGTADLRPAILPAVSAVNAKFDARWSSWKDVGAFTGVGSLSVPLGQSFGMQVEGMGGVLDGELAVGGAGHLFWRRPDIGLFGVYTDIAHAEAAGSGTAEHFAAEGELYLGRFQLEAVAGAQLGDLGEGFFSKESVGFFLTDDFEISVGHTYFPDGVGHSATASAEWLMPIGSNSLSVFGQGQVDEDGDWAAGAGLRIYFGPRKPLIRRLREDDPPDHFGLFMQAAAAGVAAEKNKSTPQTMTE